MVWFSDSLTVDLLVLSISICSFVYWRMKQRYTYWERKGFKSCPNPNFLFGHFWPTFIQKESIGELMQRIYKSMDEPFVGIYGFFRPILLVCDAEIVRNIFVRDFDYFTERTYTKQIRQKLSRFIHHSFTNEHNVLVLFIRWCTLR